MPKGTCSNCGNPILVSIYKGTGWCSDNCRKILQGEAAAVVKSLTPVFEATVKTKKAIMQEEGLRIDDA